MRVKLLWQRIDFHRIDIEVLWFGLWVWFFSIDYHGTPQPQPYSLLTLGPNNSWWGAIVSSAEYLSASLASTHYMPAATSSFLVVISKNVS